MDGLRYIVSGSIAWVSDFSIYSVLVSLFAVDPVHANLISRPAGGCVSFVMHKYFTFQNRGEARTRTQFSRFWTVWLLSFAVSQGLVFLYSRGFGWGPGLTKLGAEGGAGLIAFICQRRWTFR